MTATQSPNRAAMSRYTWRLMSIMAVYVTALIGGQFAMKYDLLGPVAAIPIALICGLCIVLTFVVMGRLIVEIQDEFVRMLFVRQSLIAAGFGFSLAAIHGFLSEFGVIDRVDAYWWPVLFFVGQFVGQISNRITYGTWGMCR